MWNDAYHLPQDLPPARQQILPEHLPLGSPWRLCPVLACSDYRCACAAPPGLPMPSVCLFWKRVPLRKKNLLVQLVLLQPYSSNTFYFTIKVKAWCSKPDHGLGGKKTWKQKVHSKATKPPKKPRPPQS